MYHYVRDVLDTPYKGIKACSHSEFIHQVKHLRSNFDVFTLEQARELIHNPELLNSSYFALTFDDGLKEHAKFVTEALVELGTPGFFYVPSQPMLEGVVLPVHKNHFLLSELSIAEYTEKVHRELDNMGIEVAWKDCLDEPAKTYRWDDAPTAQLKFVLNYKLNVEQREFVLDAIFRDVFGDEASFASELYINAAEMQEMHDAGMIIGGHSHSHNVLSSLSEEQITYEIDTNFDFLERILGKSDFWTFTYPFGKPNTYNRYVIRELKRRNVKIAFNTNVGDSKEGCSLMELQRIDPKDIIF